jgi:hypothetical protein
VGSGSSPAIGSGKFNCKYGLANQLRLLEKISEQTAGNVPKGGCCNKSLSYSAITIAEEGREGEAAIVNYIHMFRLLNYVPMGPAFKDADLSYKAK